MDRPQTARLFAVKYGWQLTAYHAVRAACCCIPGSPLWALASIGSGRFINGGRVTWPEQVTLGPAADCLNLIASPSARQ